MARAAAKCTFAGTGQDDDPHLFVILAGAQGLAQVHQIAEGQRVVRLLRIERDKCHVIDDLELNGHG
ncbi:hypothetical protein D3C87_1898460 [compost metagenome]